MGATARKKGAVVEEGVHQEFGGPIGAGLIMAFSHVLPYYLWISNFYYGGSAIAPESLGDVGPWLQRMWAHIAADAMPTQKATIIYFSFLLFEAFLAIVLPGIEVEGLPIKTENNRKLKYRCNALMAWYINLVVVFVLHYTGIFKITELFDNYGPLLTVAMIAGDVISLLIYLSAFLLKKNIRVTGNVIYDIFMGIFLNPRILNLDIKMWAEIRVSWTMLFFLTVSAAVKQYETYGVVTTPMIFMIYAHWLYTNACQKGEECIPTTWDISFECFGWMLCYWNLAGVAFVYCFQSIYIYHRGPEFNHSTAFNITLFVVITIAYYIWDTSNSQKNRFRMKRTGTYVYRPFAFPQLPWGTLENPKYIKCENGGTLLTDGWYRYARKIHYTADTVMAICWGLSCGFANFLPYFYALFFTGMIYHRGTRDMERCAEKYGKDWERYCKTVPYRFIPFVY